jgi:hypothetical protein
MATDAPKPCCERARHEYLARVTKTVTSYPLIKNIPCPTCRRVIPIRLYVAPEQGQGAG